ncbi:MAG: hypothetical protein RSB04_08635 [Gordonibacter sp.]|uniref:hypothetical protein n=1 Tax=Gordonibacter sp. TaxID=1968902 RepID=UPI002FC912A2
MRDSFLTPTVEGDGPGFSPEALAQGCAPFFSETPSKDHFGLGLNITALLGNCKHPLPSMGVLAYRCLAKRENEAGSTA